MSVRHRRIVLWSCVLVGIIGSHIVHHQLLDRHWESEWFLQTKVRSYQLSQAVLNAWNQLRLIDEADDPERLEMRKRHAQGQLYERAYELATSIRADGRIQSSDYHNLDILAYAWLYFERNDPEEILSRYSSQEVHAVVTDTLQAALESDPDYRAWIGRFHTPEEVKRMRGLDSR